MGLKMDHFPEAVQGQRRCKRYGGYQHHPFWPVKGMGTNSMKELEFYEITIFVKHSADIIVRHILNSIIIILMDALLWYWLQHVEAKLTDHYLPKDRNACTGHHLCFVNQTSCKKAHKNPTIISIRLLWYFTVLTCLKTSTSECQLFCPQLAEAPSSFQLNAATFVLHRIQPNY